MNQKKYYPTAVALYITYFILGIAVTIMGQYKQSFAAMWGAISWQTAASMSARLWQSLRLSVWGG